MTQSWPTRFLREVGTRAILRVYWFNKTGCKSHGARRIIGQSMTVNDPQVGRLLDLDYRDGAWPHACDTCGEFVAPVVMVDCECGCGTKVEAPGSARRSKSLSPLYASPDGRVVQIGQAQVGDMYYADWYHKAGEPCIHGWTNCDGKHLLVMIFDGPRIDGSIGVHPWDVDGRASNCTKKDDTTHRCWVRQGDPETGKVTVSKGGATCAAGAGSIMTDQWHGFLRNGVLVPC